MKRFAKSVLTVLLLTTAFCAPVVASDLQTATITLYHGENWVAPPLVPLDFSPTSVFAGCDINGNLTKYDAQTQNVITYSSTNQAAFGGVLLGDGYRINYYGSTPLVITYVGLPDGVPGGDGVMTDMWIGMPGSQNDNQNLGGKHWIGQPFAHNTSIESVSITDGSELLTVRQAISRGWVDSLWSGFNAQTQKGFTVGLSDFGADQNYFGAGQMYEVISHVDNLAFIIPAHAAVPEPASILALLGGLGGLCWFRRRP